MSTRRTPGTRPARRRPITIDDLWAIERAGAVALSPDGTRAVCTATRYSMDDNRGRTRLWLLPAAGEPRPLTQGDKDGQPAWSPRGDRIAFVSRREHDGRLDAAPQLYLIPADGGEAVRAAPEADPHAPGVEAFKWFPDGRRIAFVSWVWPDVRGARAQAKRQREHAERKESAYVTSEAQYRHWDAHLPMGRVPHLLVLELASGRVRDLFEGTPYELPRADPGAQHFDISPDGRRIVFTHDPQARKQFDHCKALAEVDLRSGSIATRLADAAWDFDAPRYHPDGRSIACTASHQGVKHTMPYQLALLEADGRWRRLDPARDHGVDAPLRWTADGTAICYAAEERGRRHVWRHEPASGDTRIVARGGWVQGFDLAGGRLATAQDAADHPVRILLRTLDADGPADAAADADADADAAPRRLDRFNDELFARLQLGTSDEVTITGAGGDPVQVWLTHPPGFDRRKRHPVLHVIHGGPHAASGDTFHYRWNSHLFAAQGTVIASVNYHGSSGFGQAFLDSITHRWGELELQDLEAATDWLLAQPWVEPTRIAAAGGSYGGYLVAWMNGHVPPGRYRAYVCHAGCFDWTAMFSDDGYTAHDREFGAWYWEDPERLRAQSPITHAGTMHTPTLVVHGALDYRVPDQQGLAYYNTLKARGVEARLVWFPDENHWVLKPRNSRLWYREFFDWLAAHAGPVKPPRRRPATRR